MNTRKNRSLFFSIVQFENVFLRLKRSVFAFQNKKTDKAKRWNERLRFLEKRKRIPICSFIIKAFFIVKALGQVFSSKKRLCSELYKFYEIFLIKTYTRSRHILSGCYSKYQIVGLKNSHFFYYISQILATIRDATPWEHSHKIISMFWGQHGTYWAYDA